MIRIIVAAIALLACVAGTSTACAHASLISAEPRDGAVVATAPCELTLDFNEVVAPLVLRLTDPTGSATQLTDVIRRDTSLVITPPRLLAEGTHVLSWRVISADGHPVGGSVVFSIGKPSNGGLAAGHDDAKPYVRWAILITRITIYIGLFVGVGGSFFIAWIGSTRSLPGYARTAIGATIGVALVATPLSIGLQGIDAVVASLSDLSSPVVWNIGYETPYGTTAMIATLSLLLGLVSLRAGGAAFARGLSLTALMGVGCALAASGHASTAEPQRLMRPAVLIHGIGVSIWIGSLVPLFALIRIKTGDAGAALARFSRAIPFALVPMVAAGILLAIIQLDHVSALWTTDYGRVLLAKCFGLIGLFGLAALNRFVLTPAFAHQASSTSRNFSRSIRLELAIAVVILGVVALWRFTPPPRAIAAAAAAPLFTHIHGSTAMADVTIEPGHVGPVRVMIVLRTEDFRPIETKEVKLILSKPSAGIEPIARPAAQSDDGTWRVDGFIIPLPGDWNIEVEVFVNDFEKIMLNGPIQIKR